jgi:ribonuclease P protein component
MAERLQRRDFLKLRHEGALVRSPAFLLQALPRANHKGANDDSAGETRADPMQAAPRLGFTITRRVGNAVERNRIRRRLREAIRTAPQGWLRQNHDYAVIARRDLLSLPFARLTRDLDRAFHNVHKALEGGSKMARAKSTRGPGRAKRAQPVSAPKDGCS